MAASTGGNAGGFTFGGLYTTGKNGKRTPYKGSLGGGKSSAQQAIDDYQKAYDEAKAANEARYQELLRIADETSGQRVTDIRAAYGDTAARAAQQLNATGLGNTTVAPTLAAGIERETQAALNRAADDAQQTKLGIIERRTDDYPDPNNLYAMLQYYGQSGGGSSVRTLSSPKSTGGAALHSSANNQPGQYRTRGSGSTYDPLAPRNLYNQVYKKAPSLAAQMAALNPSRIPLIQNYGSY